MARSASFGASCQHLLPAEHRDSGSSIRQHSEYATARCLQSRLIRVVRISVARDRDDPSCRIAGGELSTSAPASNQFALLADWSHPVGSWPVSGDEGQPRQCAGRIGGRAVADVRTFVPDGNRNRHGQRIHLGDHGQSVRIGTASRFSPRCDRDRAAVAAASGRRPVLLAVSACRAVRTGIVGSGTRQHSWRQPCRLTGPERSGCRSVWSTVWHRVCSRL